MTTPKTLTAMFVITLLSLLGVGLWLYEMMEIQSWYSLAWLYNQLYSPVVVISITVASFLTGIIISKNFAGTKRLGIGFILLYLVSGLSYWVGKNFCYFIYRFMAPPGILLSTIVFFVIAVFLFLGFMYWLILHQTVRANKKQNILLIAFLSFLCVPLSLLTVYFFKGLGSGSEWIDAVKMGYPIFWITLLLGIAGIVIAQQAESERK